MIKIAHRGNTKGRKEDLENSPEYINTALKDGYYCEVDVWLIDKGLFLGHDEPKYPIEIGFLINDKLICHAKNIEALHLMLDFPDIHCFWHQEDTCTLTSKNYVWKYPEVYSKGELWGICSDWF